MPSFRQVFFKLANVSRQRRPASLRVPPLILRRLTNSRMSDSTALVCKGISGRSSTRRKNGLLGLVGLRAKRLQILVELPDLRADGLDGGAVFVVVRHELGQRAFGVNPTGGVHQDNELRGAITEHPQFG